MQATVLAFDFKICFFYILTGKLKGANMRANVPVRAYLCVGFFQIDVGAFIGYHTLRLAKLAAPFEV